MNNDDDLRQLFADATSEIRPNGTLDDIRNQTKKVDPMARRWFLPSLAAAAVMALVIGGAFWMTRDTGSDGAAGPAAPPSATASDEPTVVEPPMAEMTLYYVGQGANGPRLFAEKQKVDATDAPTSALGQATGGQALDPDYTSYWPDSVKVDGTSFDGTGDDGTIGIQLSAPAERPGGTSAKRAQMEVNAVVRTAQAAFGAKAPVEFYVGEERQESVLGVAGPTFTGGNDDDVLALVSISDLVDGATVEAGKLTVKGMAAAFEANVSWEILVGGDAVIDSGFATAAECCTLSPFEFTTKIPLEGPGTYTLVVHDNDESGEGRPVNSDSKEIVVE